VKSKALMRCHCYVHLPRYLNDTKRKLFREDLGIRVTAATE